MSNYHIDIQIACSAAIPVEQNLLKQWAQLPLQEHMQKAEVTLRLVDPSEMQHLNYTYRQKDSVTNVLAFPSAIPDYIALEYPLLGDVIICPEVLQRESIQLNKPLLIHWAHIVMHGMLHLLGYDHLNAKDEKTMQTLEWDLLTKLGFSNLGKQASLMEEYSVE